MLFRTATTLALEHELKQKEKCFPFVLVPYGYIK